MTEIEYTEVSERGMTEEEENLARDMYLAIQHYSRYDERGMQTARFEVGISDLGYCSERTRRMLTQETPDDTDLLPAFIGTAIGKEVEAAAAQLWPDAITQAEVTVPLQGELNTYWVKGHPDLIVPSLGLLIDGKTSRGLALPRRVGPSQQQQFQRHCYAKAAHIAGYFDMPLDQVRVANVWTDRAGDERELYAQMEPYSPEVVEAATMWLDEVVWAYTHDQEARKEPAREVCAATCGFYATCRMLETDVTGLLTDDSVLAAVDMYREGLDMERRGGKLKDQAKAALTGVNGSTGEYSVRWVHINGGHVEYDRRASERLDIRVIK